MIEEWREIPGYEGLYEVSDLGRVRSMPRPGRRIERVYGGTMLRCGLMPNTGYPTVYLYRDGKRSNAVSVHRLVLLAFVGPNPPGMWACHNNGIRTDPRLCNLRWDTPTANEADKLRHSTRRFGEHVHSAKLTDSQVAAIRARFVRTSPRQSNTIALAAEYGVSPEQIGNIVRGLQRNGVYLEDLAA